MNKETDQRAAWLVLIISVGIITLALVGGNPPDPSWMFAVFGIAYFLRKRILFSKPSRYPFLRFASVIFVSTMLLECLAWLNNYLRRDLHPALFHPQLLPDLLIATGYYFSWTLAWWISLRRYRFSVRDVFIVTGLYGVVAEQQGAVLIAGLSKLPLGIIFWAYVFVAYGATAALAYLPFRESFSATRDNRLKYLMALILLFVLATVVSLVWNLVLELTHALPAPRPITEFPFI